MGDDWNDRSSGDWDARSGGRSRHDDKKKPKVGQQEVPTVLPTQSGLTEILAKYPEELRKASIQSGLIEIWAKHPILEKCLAILQLPQFKDPSITKPDKLEYHLSNTLMALAKLKQGKRLIVMEHKSFEKQLASMTQQGSPDNFLGHGVRILSEGQEKEALKALEAFCSNNVDAIKSVIGPGQSYSVG